VHYLGDQKITLFFLPGTRGPLHSGASGTSSTLPTPPLRHRVERGEIDSKQRKKHALAQSRLAGNEQVEEADVISQVARVDDVECDVSRQTKLAEMKGVTRPQRHRYLPRAGRVTTLSCVPRCDTRCYFNVRSKADISQLDLSHGTDN